MISKDLVKLLYIISSICVFLISINGTVLFLAMILTISLPDEADICQPDLPKKFTMRVEGRTVAVKEIGTNFYCAGTKHMFPVGYNKAVKWTRNYQPQVVEHSKFSANGCKKSRMRKFCTKLTEKSQLDYIFDSINCVCVKGIKY